MEGSNEGVGSLPKGAATPTNSKKRKVVLIVITTIFLLSGIAWFVYWLFYGRFYVSTEDAYVHGNQVQLTTQVSAGIKAIYCDETDLVEKGQLVVEMENSNYVLAYELATENLANTVRTVVSLFQDMGAQKAAFLVSKARLKLAEQELNNRKDLVETGAISIEEFEIYKTRVETATAELLESNENLGASRAKVEGTLIATHPLVLAALTSLRESYLNLIRCRVLAPMTGFVAIRSAQVGNYAKAGDTLMQIVPLDYLWVEANFKETKLGKVRIGQPVSFYSDIHGRGAKYKGKVVGYQAGSGSAFSLLPPENASGNWIKIVQRVPIRVNIPQEMLRDNPLVIGLSIHAKIDIRETTGEMLAVVPTFEPRYHTDIYQTQVEQMEALEPIIKNIIRSNIPEAMRAFAGLEVEDGSSYQTN
ncbi:MAG: HlyD family efflux transporter periplasmic adaptor subunit [Chlamydiales bacterium]